MKKRLTTEEFIKKAKCVHGDKYDYSITEYKSYHSKVLILCPVHGVFTQKPSHHLDGSGCPLCSHRSVKYTTEEYIEKAKKVHGDRYDYSKVSYVNNKEKICIICRKHGEFNQSPLMHLRGNGCPICGREKLHHIFAFTKEEFISRAKTVHGDKYDYTHVNYVNGRTNVDIMCPIHGIFSQNPTSHLNGSGCPICANESRKAKNGFTTKSFILKAKQLHGDRYDYSKVVYESYDSPVTIICKTHGEFQQTPDSHLQGSGCQKCAHKESRQESDLSKFIVGLIGKENVLIKERRIFDNPWKEIDLLIPSKHIGIEYNGIRWHSEKFGKFSDYHLSKTEECKKMGISLIHIFEDEYVNNREIVEDKIRHLLGCNYGKEKIYARRCKISEIASDKARMFMLKNHIQGFSNATVHLGAFEENRLFAVMSFRKETKNSDKWELVRFSTDIRYLCIGFGGKIFKYFVRRYSPKSVKTFADRRWTINENNNLYTKLGFKLVKILSPDYKYVVKNNRIHKFNMRKNLLLKRYPDKGLNENMTEKEMCDKLGFSRIWDCGLYKYEWISDC